MGYSERDSDVRVDFFKESGKWYTTEAVRWTGSWEDGQLIEELAVSLFAHLKQPDGSLRLADMTAICLEPYHKNSYPLMLEVSRVRGLVDRRNAHKVDSEP